MTVSKELGLSLASLPLCPRIKFFFLNFHWLKLDYHDWSCILSVIQGQQLCALWSNKQAINALADVFGFNSIINNPSCQFSVES